MAAGSLFPDGSFTHLELTPNCKSQVKKTISQPFLICFPAYSYKIVLANRATKEDGRDHAQNNTANLSYQGKLLKTLFWIVNNFLNTSLLYLTQNIFFCNLMYLPDVAASISEITVKSVPIFDVVKGETIQLNVKMKLLRDYKSIWALIFFLFEREWIQPLQPNHVIVISQT